MTRLRWLSILLLGLAAQSLADDGPGRGVARISVINGEVSVRRGDSGDIVAAAINAPLVVQDRLLTASASRAEVQFDYSNMVRLTSNTEIRLSELEYRRYQIQLAQGTITFRVHRNQDAEVEISTPSVSVRPIKRGSYRVTVLEDGTSEITVRSGEAEIFTPRGSERLKSGRTMLVRGTAADPEFQTISEIRDDDWDRWNESRDRDLDRSRSYQYVSHDIYGADDLDHHGRWVNVDQYGWVWTPRVHIDWAPYRYGRWSWVDYYGWSWISYDPWGWAPYHYGRWFYSRPYGWCWYPGGFGGRHYWSPALVAFVGFGRVGIGFGRVGWIPLAPNDPFHRWWGPRYYGGYRNRGYIDNSVTIVNNVNVTNIYRNSRVNNAVTGVDADGFSRGRPGNGMRLNEADFRQASLVQGQLPLAPARESLRMADRNPGIARPGVERDTFYSRRQVAQVDRVPFDDQRRGVEQAARTTFGEGNVRGGQAEAARTLDTARTPESGRRGESAGAAVPGLDAAGARRGLDESRPSAEGIERGSEWRRFGTPRSEDATRAGGDNNGRVRATDENGWRRLDRDAPRTSGRTEDAGRRGDEGWRTFGTPRSGGDTSTPSSGGAVRGDSTWRRMETPSTTDQTPRRSEDGWNRIGTSRGEPRTSRDEGSRRESSPETPRPERRGFDGSESIRISPPIVHQREGGFDGGRRGGDSGGFGRSQAPSAPSRSEAPSGGGSVRGSDGGGMRGGDSGGMRSSDSGGVRGGDGGGSRGGDGGSSRSGRGR